MKLLQIIGHFLVILLLTAMTQIGGLAYVIYIIIKRKSWNKWKRILLFIGIYFLFTFLITPPLARLCGRVPVNHSEHIDYHNWLTILLNRNYVVPEMNTVLENASVNLSKKYPELKLIYFDANFPFFDGFPLLPHLSHNDGKKIDLALIYKDENGISTNKKKSISGYGVFTSIKINEENRALQCKNNGYWQYEFSKYFSFGKINSKLTLDKNATKLMINTVLSQPGVKKIFLEPHLKQRMGLTHPKIRFHGCHSVRHDDHIHIEIN